MNEEQIEKATCDQLKEHLGDKLEITIGADVVNGLYAEYHEVNDDMNWWYSRYMALDRAKREYKARIDKAIEYLDKFYDEESNHWKYDFDNTNKQELYEILKGIDKE